MKKLGFNIILLGMIASGKETQANILRKKFALKLVETGVYSRKLLREKSREGERARKTTGKGHPLPTKLLQKFLIKAVRRKPENKNLLFLGGRLKPEAQLLVRIMKKRKEKLLVFYLTLPDKEVYKRSLLRSKGKMKKIYKVLDQKHLITRRIKWHKTQVGKTVQYYQKLRILRKINGNQPISKVTKDILREVEKYKTRT